VSDKYRQACAALIALKGAEYAPQFRELKAADLNVNAEEESDLLSRKKLGCLGNSRWTRIEPTNAKKTFSWIWTVGGGPGEDQGQLHDSKLYHAWFGLRITKASFPLVAVRVEWSKARARRDRWVEEVEILREEMKCVLRFLAWLQQEWRSRAVQRVNVDPELAAGLKAYALRQVAVHRRVTEGFHAGWNVSVATAVRDVVRQDGMVYRGLLDRLEIDAVPTVLLGLNAAEEVEESAGPSTRWTSEHLAANAI
jgi:hypothetical protein